MTVVIPFASLGGMCVEVILRLCFTVENVIGRIMFKLARFSIFSSAIGTSGSRHPASRRHPQFDEVREKVS